MTNDDHRSYLQRREKAEREAAKHAACPEARRAHQELAQMYAAARMRISEAEAAPKLDAQPITIKNVH
jgi:hypothetical protein